MSIASDLEKTNIRIRCLLQRGNDEIVAKGPDLLHEVDLIIDRVRGLEEVACVNTDILKDFQAKGGVDVQAGN